MKRYGADSKSVFLTKRIYEIEEECDDSELLALVREPFQRDRDRIIHSRAFRRLMHKTQIFNANLGDHYRNRLTHTMEVSQIARSLGKAMNLNDELIEAIALGHDLGHTPFGHVGERTLHKIITGEEGDYLYASLNGFKHNYQGVHLVDNIENGSSNYKGMNLTLAVREGILKHTGHKIKYWKSGTNAEKIVQVVHYECLSLDGMNIEQDFSFTLEGQIVAICSIVKQMDTIFKYFSMERQSYACLSM